MNGRDRLLKTFKHEPVDRIPVAPLVYANAVYEMFDYRPDIETFYDPPDFDLLGKCVEYCDHYGFDVAMILGHVWDFFGWSTYRDHTITRSWENWDVSISDIRKPDAKQRTVDIRTPDGSLRHVEEYRKVSPYLVVWATAEYLIKTKEDFEILRKYCPPCDVMDCRMVTRARQAVGDKGIIYPGMQGAFNTLNVFRRLDQIMQDPYIDEGFYREMIEYFSEWLIRRIPKWVQAGVDAIELGANLAGSGVGPDFFERFVLNYENTLLEEIHRHGVFAGYHNCGDAAKIMHLYNRMPMECWGYLTPPPYGDVILEEALRVIRPDIILRGNIDHVDFLRKAKPGEIRTAVQQLLEKVKPRGNWILATTDFWIDNIPRENIMAFAQAGRDYGYY